MQRDPGRYDVPRQPSNEALDRWLRDRLLLGCLRELAEHGMVHGPGSGQGGNCNCAREIGAGRFNESPIAPFPRTQVRLHDDGLGLEPLQVGCMQA